MLGAWEVVFKTRNRDYVYYVSADSAVESIKFAYAQHETVEKSGDIYKVEASRARGEIVT